jgi:hypothetical protein
MHCDGLWHHSSSTTGARVFLCVGAWAAVAGGMPATASGTVSGGGKLIGAGEGEGLDDKMWNVRGGMRAP